MSQFAIIGFLVQCLTFTFLLASEVDAQKKQSIENIYLTLEMKEASIKDVFNTIEGKTSFSFAYKRSIIEKNKKISASFEQESLANLLRYISQSTGLSFKRVDETIQVNKNDSSEPFLEEFTQILADVDITGKITDENGEGLPGASVIQKGTTNGTTTDLDGKFKLSIPEEAILVVSFVGYKTAEIPLAGRSTIDVQMELDAEQLDEIVVVGYGTQKKSDLTGAVGSVSLKRTENLPVTSVEQALSGQLAGVQVQQGSGAPGTMPIIRVRGTGSITAGNGPLFVVDGFPIDGDLSSVNMNDVSSIEVLKDASASAIYGSRGSNGVVLITTKKGVSGKPKIEANVYYGFQEVTKKVDVLNATEWVELLTEARDNAYIDAGGDLTVPLESRPAAYQYPSEYTNPASFGEGTDYQDAIFQLAPTQRYNVSISGGTDNTQYFVSANYLDQDGIIKNSAYKKYAVRLGTDIKLNKKIKVGINVTPTYSVRDNVNAEGHWGSNGAVLSALNLPPIFPLYEDDGSYGSLVDYGWGMPSIPTPLVPINELASQTKKLNVLGIAYAEWDILPSLKFRTSLNANVTSSSNDTYRTSQAESDGAPAPQPPSASYTTNSNDNILNENTLTYTYNIKNRHSFNVLLGYSVQKSSTEGSYIYATNFPNDQVRTLNAGVVTSGNSIASEWSLLSYLGRINYVLNDKYLMTASIRRDGSSRFGANNKWGVFPSVSIGWRVAQEDFMKNIPLISDLKLRTSYGFTGNNSIPNYGSVGLLNIDNYTFGGGSGSLVSGIVPGNISNEKLGWEKTKQFDLGFEIGLFKNRLFLEVDNYYRFTTDLLLNVQVPTLSGYSSALQNIGEVKNVGWEFTLNTKNFVSEFKWNTSLNISTNQNKVLALGPEGDPIYSYANITQLGSPLGSYYGYVFEGVYNTQAEIDARPHLSSDAPGDPIIRDTNEDGLISPDDRTIIGDNLPDYIFGITNSFSYKNFDLSVLMQGAQGYRSYLHNYLWLYLTEGKMNVSSDLLNRWKSPENPGDGQTPRADAKTEGYRRTPSTLWVKDASFLRINNVTLGYSLPEKLTSQIYVSSLRVYLQVQNLHTFTKYSGYNPEVSNTSNPLEPGKDYGGYPVSRTFTLGFNIQF